MPEESTPIQQLLTQAEVQAQFDAASEVGVSPCMWIPPDWDTVSAKRWLLTDNSKDDTGFTNPAASIDGNQRISEGHAKKAPKAPESKPDKDYWVHPFADFSHIDDSEVLDQFDRGGSARKMNSALITVAAMFKGKRDIIVAELKGDAALFDKAVEVLEGKAFAVAPELEPVALIVEKGGQVHDLVTKVLRGHAAAFDGVVDVLRGSADGRDIHNQRDALAKLDRIVGSGSYGMERLRQVFEWVLYRTTELMKDLNDALERKAAGEQDYIETRTNYINLLRDLDDHEPGLSDVPVDVTRKKARSAYGKALKWGCIDPVIFAGRIVGARAVIKWNPHSSSSGYPIPHP